MDEDYIVFNREKLKSVVHYVCSQCEPHELGNVKLHKILYFADMLHFMATDKPLTGVDYLKQQFGPVARHLSSILAELVREKKLQINERDYFGFKKKDYIAVKSQAATPLSNSEINLLNEVIDFVCARTAKEISELSHDIAWRLADIGERIPYAAVLGMEPVAITQEDVEFAVAEAERLRPMMEADRHARAVR
jgi:uncharacterized phage-associated protein